MEHLFASFWLLTAPASEHRADLSQLEGTSLAAAWFLSLI